MGQTNSISQKNTDDAEESKAEPTKMIKQVDRFIYDPETDEIGSGVFATVYKGIDPTNNDKEVAIKRISKEIIQKYRDYQDLFLREINTLLQLEHPFCIKLEKAFRSDTGNFYFVTSFCNQGDLAQLLKRRKTLTETEALTVVRQIAEAMNALKGQSGVVFMHRDIKPATNLLHDG